MTNCSQASVYQFLIWKVELSRDQSLFWPRQWRFWTVSVFILQIVHNRFRETFRCLESWNSLDLFLLWQLFKSLKRQLFTWFWGINQVMNDRWLWHRGRRQFCLQPFSRTLLIFLTCLFSFPVAWVDCRVPEKKMCLISWAILWTNSLDDWSNFQKVGF
jgi:hypothetical protein